MSSLAYVKDNLTTPWEPVRTRSIERGHERLLGLLCATRKISPRKTAMLANRNDLLTRSICGLAARSSSVAPRQTQAVNPISSVGKIMTSSGFKLAPTGAWCKQCIVMPNCSRVKRKSAKFEWSDDHLWTWLVRRKTMFFQSCKTAREDCFHNYFTM